MTLSDANGSSTFVIAGAGMDVGGWMTRRLARPRTDVDPAGAAEPPRGGHVVHAPAIDAPDLATVGEVQRTTDRPVPKSGIQEVLAAWRAAERELDDVPENSPEWSGIHAKLVGLRASYQQLFTEFRDRRPSGEDRWLDEGRPALADGFQLFGAR